LDNEIMPVGDREAFFQRFDENPYHRYMGLTVFSKAMPGSEPAGTADLSITYLRQAHGRWLDAKATVTKRGRQLSTVAIEIFTDEGRLCSSGRVLYAMRTAPDNA
jgi:acyl-coenzyme A thioesterase PaaI-like protein